jgi:hypothetical protein
MREKALRIVKKRDEKRGTADPSLCRRSPAGSAGGFAEQLLSVVTKRIGKRRWELTCPRDNDRIFKL